MAHIGNIVGSFNLRLKTISAMKAPNGVHAKLAPNSRCFARSKV